MSNLFVQTRVVNNLSGRESFYERFRVSRSVGKTNILQAGQRLMNQFIH